ncbi:SIR2 family protein [Mucilaginibacter litoreus]|uniref:SIR2 family protein n=1 Tax=Mucilaginibacter litoreus TaxID=1048221 RepID=A0ABW3AMJ0_9SPHI
MAFDPTKIPSDLIDSLQKHKAGVYVGAGLSQAVGLPGWGALLSELVQLSQTVSYQPNQKFIDDVNALIADPAKFLVAAQELKDFLQDDLRKYIINKFADKCPPPSDLHKLLIKLPFTFFITTNYDTLLENAYVLVNQKQAKVYTFKDSPDIAYDLWNGTQFILKAHGDANKAQQGIILTERDYRQILFQERGYQSILQSLFTTKTILFLGSSLSDPELKLLLSFIHSSFHGGGPTHYALISEDQMNSAEAESWRKNFNIKVIAYSPKDNHQEVFDFLTELEGLIS